MIYFTSDQHFGHRNIIRLCKRPFESLEEMHEVLISNYKSRVTEEDHTYFLGDVFMCNLTYAEKLLKRMPGKKTLILGNHDKVVRKNLKSFSQHFEEICDQKELHIHKGKYMFVLSHYPFYTWYQHRRGSINLHGHIHSKTPCWRENMKQVDVGVDACSFKPVSYLEIIEALTNAS